MVFKLTYFFRNPVVPYLEDVFLHPDMYLSVVSLFLAASTAGLIFYAGFKVFQTTKSVFYAVLVQTAPFLPVIWFDLIGRVAPELVMPFPVILLTVLLIEIYFRKEEYTWKSVLLLAFFSAFGLSIKLTFLPLWFLPFIVIEGWKKKLGFVLSAFLMFFIIAFPMTLQFGYFWGWVKNLFMHSGNYGAGDSNVIDFASLKTNLRELYGYEKRYFYVFFSLIGVLIVYLGWFRKKAEKRIVLLSLALIISISLQIVMVGKHYAHRYFIPVLMLSPLLVFTISEMIKKFYPKRITRYLINIGIVLLLIGNVQFHKQWLPIKTNALETEMESRRATWHAVQTLNKDCYKIIASQNYGAPFIEYTLFYSMVWGNHKKQEEYKPILNKLYPNAYSHFTWDNSMKYWGEKFSVQQIIDSGKKTYLYLERNEEEQYNKTINRLMEEDGTSFETNRELIYQNPKTSEIIYQLNFSRFENKTDSVEQNVSVGY